MSLAVRDISDQALRFSQLCTDQFHDIDIAHLVVTADIVDLTDTSSAKDQIDRFAVVLHIQPVSDVEALAVDGKRLVMKRIGDHERDQLLRELIRSVVVGAAADGHRQTVCPVIGQHQKICRGLRCAVGAARVDRRLFREKEVRSVQRQVTVHFIRGDLMEPLDAVLSAGIHEYCRAHDVGLEEDPGVLDRAVHVGLRGKIHHNVRFLLLKQLVDPFPVPDIQFDETELRILHDGFQR